MKALSSAPQPPVVVDRDRARDSVQDTRAQVWKDYTAILDAADKPLMKAALFFTPGGRAAMTELSSIMQADTPPEQTYKAFMDWARRNDAATGALAFSVSATNGLLNLGMWSLPRMARAHAEFERADQALSRAMLAA